MLNLKEKTHYMIIFFSTFKLPAAIKNPLNIIFDDFGIRLLDRI